MTVDIAISDRARKYGYVIWPKKQDDEVRGLLNQQETVNVIFNQTEIGERRVDWKYRRISVGPSHTRPLAESLLTFRLTCPESGRLSVNAV